MNRSSAQRTLAMQRSGLGLYQPPDVQANTAHWRINGYRAAIVIWTAEEWERLTDRPTDARYFPCGVWCALRVE